MQARGPVALAYLVLAVGMLAWHRHFGFIDYGGQDGGTLVLTAWAVAHGSIPYLDLPNPLPPLFFLAPGLAFVVGGASWSSLNWLLCVFALLSFTWSFLLLSRISCQPWLALFYAVAFQGVTLLPLSWWWYNQTTDLIALLAMLSGYGLARAPKDRVYAASLGCAVTLLMLSKINTAAPVCLFLVVILLLRPATRLPALAALAGAALVDGLLLLILRISPFAYLQLLREFSVRVSSGSWTYYCAISSLPAEHLLGIQLVVIVTLVAGGLIWAQDDAARKRDLTLWLGMALVTSCIQIATNNDFKTIDTLYPLMLIALALPGVKRRPPLYLWGSIGLICTLFLLGLGLAFGLTRARVFSMGAGLFGEGTPPTHVIQDPAFFRGLETEDRLFRVLEQIGHVVQAPTASSSHSKFFFGPRLEFGYAAYDQPFPKGLPLWWEKVPSSHLGGQYPMGLVSSDFLVGPSRWLPDDAPFDPRVQRFIDEQFTTCIFVRGFSRIADMTFMPPNLRGYIYEHYRMTDYPDIVVFARK